MKLVKCLFFLLLLSASFSVKAQRVHSWKVTRLSDYINKSDSVLVINFWATFCKPCLEELPYYQTLVDKYKTQKVKLLLVSMDLKDAYPAKIEDYIQKNNVSSEVVWLNETNADYFCPKVNKAWMGGIPATYFVNAKTGYKKFFEQQMTPQEFEIELNKALAPTQ